jgi:predicted acetyltransferase
VAIEFRPIVREETAAFMRAEGTAFAFVPNAEDIEHMQAVLDFERTLAACDGQAIVGTSGALAMSMTIPGGAVLPTAGVTMVTVTPSHRRRGVLTAMMRRLLASAHDRDEPLAALWASESLIYGRFGYGLAIEDESWEIERVHARFAPHAPAPKGTIHLVDQAYAAAHFPDVWERVRLGRTGMTARDDALWQGRFRDPTHDRGGATPYFFAAYEEGGRIDGYALYRVKGGWPLGIPTNEITVVEAIAATDAAHTALWRLLLDLDLSSVVRTEHRPLDDPLPHMLADYRRLRRARRDAIWLRLVDLRAALEARSYAAPGSLVFEVPDDDLCPWNPTRFTLECGAEGGHVTTSASATSLPDLSMHAADLAAIYLGGQRPSMLARAGRIEEHRPGALAQADALFATAQVPWCPQFF